MKKLYFLLVGICFFGSVNAQIINIPDGNFKFWLLYADIYSSIAKDVNGNNIKIDLNSNDEIEASEALNVYELDLRNKEIINLNGISFFKNLKNLNCQENNIENLDVSELINLVELNCIYNKISSVFVTDLKKLKTLDLSQNQIKNISFQGLTNLESLSIANNQLTSLDIYGLTNLKSIICLNNKISSFQASGLSLLENIDISTNQISSLNLSELINLKSLNCRENKLTTIDFSKINSITALYCSGNLLTSLNVNNLIKLEYLFCNGNLLENLETKTLSHLSNLNCSSNSIKKLDLSNNILLNSLDCTYNLLTELNLNTCVELNNIYCGFNNLLEAVYIKNNVFTYNMGFAPNPSLKFICTSEGLISHYYRVIGSSLGSSPSCQINSYCSFTPGGTFYTIKGKSKLDTDNNGCTTNDAVYKKLKFKITDGTTTGNFISDSSGNYSIPIQAGIHTVTPIIENSNYFNISPNAVNVTFPSELSPYNQDFCVTPNGIHNDLEVTILPLIPARPGFDATYRIIYKNKGTTMQSGSVVLTFNDEVLDYVSATPIFDNQITNKLTWNYSDLRSFETREINFTLNVNSPMETPAVNNGDRLSFNALITPVAGDEKPVDNSFALRQSVVGSFDPNDKTCLEGDVITPELIGEYVHYLIRFENTGNYAAQNIVVKDLIDLSKFDISTLEPTKASHEFVTKISEGNKVEFIFESINLPFDDATNDGYIAFKIKTLPTLVTGDSFANEANIYFDYNFPILTNKATSTFKTLGTQDFQFLDYFSVYPNPVNDILNIGTKNTIELKSISIYDMLGQLVIAVPNAQNISKADVSKLSKGNYFLKMNTDKGTSSFKFIKQ
ncbi:DUF7619 domain-containing protein [Flavobacterium degerlachei]|jgi:Leucine-rich repeat (LRR) protein|nr:leucine-rich repeat domain-containing protein [Flavobacterium degerlachei]